MDLVEKVSLRVFSEADFQINPLESIFSANIGLLREQLLGGMNGAEEISHESERTSTVSCD
jgi:hypothetical protein